MDYAMNHLSATDPRVEGRYLAVPRRRFPRALAPLAVAALACSIEPASAATPPPDPPKVERFSEDKLATAIVFLFKQTPITVNGAQAVQIKSGTGTLMVSAKGEPVLVTAAHVARDVGTDGALVLRGEGDKPIQLPISKLLGHEDAWVFHERADVAVLRLHPDRSLGDVILKGRFMPVSVVAREDAAPKRDVTLLTIGFPQNLGVDGRFSPLWLRSMPASGLFTVRADASGKSNTYFVLDQPSIGGLSGALVFDMGRSFTGSGGTGVAISHGPTLAWGLMSGTISDDTGGKLAAVVPSKAIIETLAKAGVSTAPDE